MVRQYSHIYAARLNALKPKILEQIEDKSLVKSVIKVKAGEKNVIIVGTMIKNHVNKPSIIEKFANEFDGKIEDTTKTEAFNFCSEGDTLELEDETGKIELINIPEKMLKEIVTGVVVGLKGNVDSAGNLEVSSEESFIFPGSSLSSTLEANMNIINDTSDKCILFLSNLRIGSDSFEPLLLQMILNLLRNNLKDRIARIIISGETIVLPDIGKGKQLNINKKLGTDMQQIITSNLVLFDEFLSDLLSLGLPCDLMPSCTSCLSSKTIPQQPLSKILFNYSEKYTNLNLVTNPYEFTQNKVNCLGVDFGIIKDILVHSNYKENNKMNIDKETEVEAENNVLESISVFKVMKKQLFQWRHLAPTAPDSFPMFPLSITDPLALPTETTPNLYFCSSPFTYSESKMNNTVLLQLPDFSKFGEVILYSLNGNIEKIKFEMK